MLENMFDLGIYRDNMVWEMLECWNLLFCIVVFIVDWGEGILYFEGVYNN